MSTRNYLAPDPVIVNGDMSADIVSDVTILQQKTIAAYSYSWAGAVPVGAISIEVSNDYKLDADGRTVANPGTWIAVPVSSGGTMANSVPLTGNTGEGYIEGASGAYAIRTKYTFTSGTGSLQAIFVGKVF